MFKYLNYVYACLCCTMLVALIREKRKNKRSLYNELYKETIENLNIYCVYCKNCTLHKVTFSDIDNANFSYHCNKCNRGQIVNVETLKNINQEMQKLDEK